MTFLGKTSELANLGSPALTGQRPYLWAAVSGLMMFFIFPNSFHLEFWPLAWVCLVPLFYALSAAERPRQAALIAVWTGVAGYPLLYHWLIYTFNHYAAMGYVVSGLILLLLVLALSSFLALMGALHYYLNRRLGWPVMLAAPMAWTAVEYLRAYFPFGGFPWNLLAYSQHAFLPVIQISEFTGPYGVSFLIVLANAALAQTLLRAGERPLAYKHLLWGLGLPLLAVIYGWIRIPRVDRAFANQPAITVGIVQANVDQGVKWDAHFFWKAMDQHLALTEKIMKDQPALVMWPEAAVTVSNFNEHWKTRSQIIDFLSQINTYFLTGAPSREPCGPPGPKSTDEENLCYFNSAYLLSPHAENLLGRYDKMHLVPFGEYVPLKKLFFFADAIAHGNTGGSSSGREVKLLSMPGLTFGCVICYEVIFPHLCRRFVKAGASVMTTITNDAWFGKTGAPYQHHANVVFRAVENRVYFARAANTGVSSIVDPVGRVIHQTPLYEPASFVGQVKPSPLQTFYTNCGDFFAQLVSAVALLALAFGWLRPRIKK